MDLWDADHLRKAVRARRGRFEHLPAKRSHFRVQPGATHVCKRSFLEFAEGNGHPRALAVSNVAGGRWPGTSGALRGRRAGRLEKIDRAIQEREVALKTEQPQATRRAALDLLRLRNPAVHPSRVYRGSERIEAGGRVAGRKVPLKVNMVDDHAREKLSSVGRSIDESVDEGVHATKLAVARRRERLLLRDCIDVLGVWRRADGKRTRRASVVSAIWRRQNLSAGPHQFVGKTATNDTIREPPVLPRALGDYTPGRDRKRSA